MTVDNGLLKNRFIFLLAFLSGFCIMSVELMGGRILAPYFGSSIYVWGSIITIFMVALSAGYLLGGQWSMHAPSLRKFSLLYLCGAVTLLPLVFWGDTVMEQVFIRIMDPRYGSLVAAMLLFFLPTLILGMISPYSIRLLISDSGRSGQVAGKLYFVSTLGSALGTLLTSFYLVLWFEVNTILLSLIGILCAGGVIAFYVRFPRVVAEA
ncbi:fused MFS/spermidine synthase [Vibrio rhizosphaerae]|uniref:Fused MFS/spermidine synthase n=1 Tax=Vibrio rhizosphaerae TaxID=398736 RepID=A0ABU4IYX2_9VIBR|nr:fused MFS/spermidine synthase [Vibrio rhizosphaerae]MDW6094469.1 fused MFS/spermidine synthase [Vibrio rhizosphaerae]